MCNKNPNQNKYEEAVLIQNTRGRDKREEDRKKNEQSLQLFIANIIVAATNKISAIFPCRLCFLRAFPFISFIYMAGHNNTI